MRIALVHELLTMKGGAERVFKILTDMFPEAPIYTLLYDQKKTGDWFPRERVRTSFLQNTWTTRLSQLVTGSINHHLYLKKFPKAVEAWDFSEFDLVISSSSAFAHGILTNGTPKHICYVHSPARYLWDRTHDVMTQAGGFKSMYGRLLFHRLRTWDTESAERPDMLLAASGNVQRRIQLYWRRQSTVLYPPIDDTWLSAGAPGAGAMEHPEYFLVVSTLARYKRIDLAVEACNRLGIRLKIVGEGWDMQRLRHMAGETVEFYGFRQGDELRNLYANARATLFPGDEDFGLVPLESLACGTPVIAYRGGGALETVTDGTGMFFSNPTVESLMDAIKSYDKQNFSADDCRAQAARFSRAAFEKGLHDAIDAVTKE